MLSCQPFAIKDEFITADDVLSFEVSPTTITTGNLIIVVIIAIIIIIGICVHFRVVGEA